MTNFTNTTYCPVNELTNTLCLETDASPSGVSQNSCTIAFRKRVEGEMKCRTSFRDNETAWVWREGQFYDGLHRLHGHDFQRRCRRKHQVYVCV